MSANSASTGVVAIVQTRMSSRRMPGKSLYPLAGIPLIEHVNSRISGATGIGSIVYAIPVGRDDDPLDRFIRQHLGAEVFRGSALDVLGRFHQAAKKLAADVVVRVTGDDPLKDPAVIDQAIAEFWSFPGTDYVSNTLQPTYPEGVDIEVISWEALERAALEAVSQSDREHVTSYVWRNPNIFTIRQFVCTRSLGNQRWTLDTPQDAIFLDRLIRELLDNEVPFDHLSVAAFLQRRPDLQSLMDIVPRNDGYIRSIEAEK